MHLQVWFLIYQSNGKLVFFFSKILPNIDIDNKLT